MKWQRRVGAGMDIIAFGTGQVGMKVLPMLEKSHHILFVADHDERKWGTTFGKYIVKSPDEIKKYDCRVVIITTRHAGEIAKQLLEMGISDGRVFFCREYQGDKSGECDVYPMVMERIPGVGFPLVQYDLCHVAECGTDRKKVLVACIFYSVYMRQVIENISKRYTDIDFSILTSDKKCCDEINSGQIKHIYYFRTMADLKNILEQLPVYDAMQFLWIENEWCYFYRLIREKTKRLNLNVGGSDFYRSSDCQRDYKRALIACADSITAETKGTVKDFEAYYKDDIRNSVGLLPFGIEVLDWIDRTKPVPTGRKKFGIPEGRIVVTCGHNANQAHQHFQITEALECLPGNVKEQCVFVFPMTYPGGQEEYIGKVKDRLAKSGLEYVVLTDFMDFQGMAEYALISDIMLHVQTTDQLSSTMLEEMYAESIVIAGKWLPYGSLHEMGLYFLDVDEIKDITDLLWDVVVNISEYKHRCRENPDIVWNHSSWDALAPKWHALWE